MPIDIKMIFGVIAFISDALIFTYFDMREEISYIYTEVYFVFTGISALFYILVLLSDPEDSLVIMQLEKQSEGITLDLGNSD